jgi:hypothetical protein
MQQTPEKIKFWRKLSTNKKMIYAMPLIVEMIDLLEDQEKQIAELKQALLWSRDSNTGNEPSVSVMHRYYDELLPSKKIDKSS